MTPCGELGGRTAGAGGGGACWDIEPEALRRNAAGLLSALCPQAEAAGVRLPLAPGHGAGDPLIAESPCAGQAGGALRVAPPGGQPCPGGVPGHQRYEHLGRQHPPVVSSGWGEHTGLVRLCDGNYHGWRAWGEGVRPWSATGRSWRRRAMPARCPLPLPGERYAGRPSWLEEGPGGPERRGGMRGIKRSQLVNMNQHYRRFSMDFFLDCQRLGLGIGQIELWCGAAHFWLDHTGYDDVSALRAS